MEPLSQFTLAPRRPGPDPVQSIPNSPGRVQHILYGMRDFSMLGSHGLEENLKRYEGVTGTG
jgi:hypothetical protein